MWEIFSQINAWAGIGKNFPAGLPPFQLPCYRPADPADRNEEIPPMAEADLRSRFTEAMKAAMLAKDSARTSTVRMIIARLKEVDIAARPSGVEKVPDEQIASMLRTMVKSRRESADLYRQGNRPELAAKEEAEIAVIESFLPQQMDEAAMREAVRAAVAEAGASTVKDMGKVMAVLRAKHAATMDLSKAGPVVKAALGG
jgi:uncharacterized protein